MPDFMNYFGPSTPMYDPNAELRANRGQEQMLRQFERMDDRAEQMRREELLRTAELEQRSRDIRALDPNINPWMPKMMGDLNSGMMAANMEFDPLQSGEDIARGAYNSAGAMAPAIGLRAPPTTPMDPGFARTQTAEGYPGMGGVQPLPNPDPRDPGLMMTLPATGATMRPSPSMSFPAHTAGGLGLEIGPGTLVSEAPPRGPSAFFDPQSAPIPYPEMAAPAPVRAPVQRQAQAQPYQGPRTPEAWANYKTLQGQLNQLNITRESTTSRMTAQQRTLQAKQEAQKATLGGALTRMLSEQTRDAEKIAGTLQGIRERIAAAPPKRQGELVKIYESRVRTLETAANRAEALAVQLVSNGVDASEPGSVGFKLVEETKQAAEKARAIYREAEVEYQRVFAETVGRSSPFPSQERQAREAPAADLDALFQGYDDEALQRLVSGGR